MNKNSTVLPPLKSPEGLVLPTPAPVLSPHSPVLPSLSSILPLTSPGPVLPPLSPVLPPPPPGPVLSPGNSSQLPPRNQFAHNVTPLFVKQENQAKQAKLGMLLVSWSTKLYEHVKC